MFRIELFDRWPGFRIEGFPACYGRISWGIGPYDYETFIAPTDYKSARWYRRQWDTALRRILDGEAASSLIVTAGPPGLSLMEVWDFWRLDSERAVMHNCLVPPPMGEWHTERSELFSLTEPWASAGAYAHFSDDGSPISEWTIPMDDIEEFMRIGGPLGTKPAARVWPPPVRRARERSR